MKRLFLLFAASVASLTGVQARAAESETCKAPKFSDVGWTDITATTALASLVLEKAGYQPQTTILSVPVTFQSLENGQIDIFLGNWMPLQEEARKPYLEGKKIEQAGINLEGAKIGLAATGKDLGIKNYADIAKFKDQLGGKIYGIEAGSSANATIQSMVEQDKFGLKDFQLAESSEQAMLSQVQNAVRKEEPVVFFAWTPHPMNIRYKLTYLENGDNLFGPDDGAATVETLTRKGYATDCPNVSRFLSNLKFNTAMESTMMNMILNDGMEAKDAVTKWIKENPAQLDAWLDGVTTFDGKPALAEVKSELGL
ncbi:choline ABC transporter substrate-binding protein [Ochrobactrum vermis]|uniref:Choline ABC transporter substrate-binding protein n=1 Tax=Ochrobactrum vermis TaxID=1827297 RepID=A0ABU8PKE5_9HYPH|nr:choline ABC transporter substrate-binding protein [Ochrobactrum vermis]PQZ26762.1 glycine/betaine ABC transporter substrate-binding protein [Ochrobactrum vermis]